MLGESTLGLCAGRAKGSYVAENLYREGGYQPDFDMCPSR
jgi:hypothetical protein